MSESKNSLLGFLRDSGVSATICTRIGELINAFNGNLDQFVIATDGQLEATYNKSHPGSSKGLGKGTFKALDMLRGRYRHANSAIRKAEEADRAEKAALRAAATENLRNEVLGESINLKIMGEVVAGLSTMLDECDLDMILEVYHRKTKGTR